MSRHVQYVVPRCPHCIILRGLRIRHNIKEVTRTEKFVRVTCLDCGFEWKSKNVSVMNGVLFTLRTK